MESQKKKAAAESHSTNISEEAEIRGSIQTIAREVGVSTATVSRVFSGKDYVSADVRKRVIAAAEKRGYNPKKYKKNKGSKRYMRMAGVIIPDLDSLFYSKIVAAIQSILDQNHINTIVACSNNQLSKELILIDVFQQIAVDGLILVPVSDKNEYNLQVIKELQSKIPVVLLDRDIRSENMDGVFMNDYSSAYRGVSILTENGHRKIAFLNGPGSSSSAAERLAGFQDAMKANKLSVKPEWILQGNFNTADAYMETKKLLLAYPFGKLPVTAIFSANARMLEGCIKALTERGYKVGTDIALLSYGHSEIFLYNISQLQYPSRKMGEECAHILLERWEHTMKEKNNNKKRIIFEIEEKLLGSEKMPTKYSTDLD